MRWRPSPTGARKNPAEIYREERGNPPRKFGGRIKRGNGASADIRWHKTRDPIPKRLPKTTDTATKNRQRRERTRNAMRIDEIDRSCTEIGGQIDSSYSLKISACVPVRSKINSRLSRSIR